MNKIIKITPIHQDFYINWNIGLYCNFDCMYCPSFYHNKTSKHKTLSELQENWKEILIKTQHLDKKYKISFTGGEPTSNKDFSPFVSFLNNEYGEIISGIGITSNGTAGQKYYEKLIKLPAVQFISLSLHSEFFNEKKFFDTVKHIDTLGKNLHKQIHVNIMNEFWNLSKIEMYKSWLEKNNIYYTVNEIDYSYKIRNTPSINRSNKLYEFY